MYVLCTEWPKTAITLTKIKPGLKKVSMLGVSVPVKAELKAGKLIIKAPVATPAQVKGKYAYVFKVERAL